MRALVYDGSLSLRRDHPRPVPADGEALLAVRLAGVCKTDLEILKGYMGFVGVMGHEFVGEVLEGPARWCGKRVTADINCPCGQCELCRCGLGNHCRRRGVLGIDKRGGVFADFVAVPLANLHEIPPHVSDDAAVFVEPLAAAFQMLHQVTFAPGERVAVLGDGRLGQLAARVLATVGSPVLVGKHGAKLALAAAAGIETVPLEQFKADGQYRVVVDATGSEAGFELAMRAVQPRGVIVLKSTFAGGGRLNLAPLVINEVTVVGSRCGPFDEAIAALASGSIEVASLISRRFPLDDAAEAIAAAGDGKNMKVLIAP